MRKGWFWTLAVGFSIAVVATIVATSLASNPMPKPAEANEPTYLIDASIAASSGEGITGSARDGQMSTVSVHYRWSTEVYPGQATCAIRLRDADGSNVGSKIFQLEALQPEGNLPAPLSVPWTSAPTMAEGYCSAAVPPQSDALQISEVSVVSEKNELSGESEIRLHANIKWSTSEPPGTQYCRLVTGPTNANQWYEFTLDASPTAGLDIRLPSDFPTGGDPGLTCEPFVGQASSEGTT